MNLSLTSTQASSIFVDANIVLEIILERQNQQLSKDLLLKYSDKLSISSLTAHLITYFGQQRVDLPVLRHFLEDYTILSSEASFSSFSFVLVIITLHRSFMNA